MSRGTNVQRRSSSVGAQARSTVEALVEELGTVFQGQPSPLRRGGHVRPSQIRSEAPAAMQEPTALQQQGSVLDDSEVTFRPQGQMNREEWLQRLMARHGALAAEMASFMAGTEASSDEDVAGESSRPSRAATPRRASDAAQDYSGTGQEQTVHPSTLTASHRGQQTAQAVTAAQQQEEQPSRAATPARQEGSVTTMGVRQRGDGSQEGHQDAGETQGMMSRARRDLGLFSRCLKYLGRSSVKRSTSSWKIVFMMNRRSFEKIIKLPDLPADSPALRAWPLLATGHNDS